MALQKYWNDHSATDYGHSQVRERLINFYRDSFESIKLHSSESLVGYVGPDVA